MTTDYHTAIANGAAANASIVNTPIAALDAAIGLQGGGAIATASVLRAWAGAESFRASSITRNANGVITDATVTWPDGSGGTWETTRGNNAAGSDVDDTDESRWYAPNTITITHTDSSQTVTVTITRNSSHAPTAVAIGVA